MSEFDTYAGDYDAALLRGVGLSGESAAHFAEGRVLWLRRILSQRGFVARRVLDYGCGVGNAAPYFLKCLGVESVTGVDISRASLDVARKAHEGLPVTFMGLDEYVPNGDVDLAFCNGVFHHIPPAERPAAFRQIADSLRPGGLFAFWENNPWSPAARYVMRRIPFDNDAVMVWPYQARTLAASVGMRIEGTDFCFIFPRALRCLRRTEACLRRFPFGAQYLMLCRKPDSRHP